jgi:hypothetical protein
MYDIKILGRNDPFVQIIDEAMRILEDCMVPGKYLVEFIPQRRLPNLIGVAMTLIG